MFVQIPALTHVAVTENGDLVVKHGKLDVTVPLFMDGIQWSNLILSSIPVNLEMLLLVLLAQDLVERLDDLFVSTALERNRFALVIETCSVRLSVNQASNPLEKN